jgi:ATP-binding cassette subfamily B protein
MNYDLNQLGKSQEKTSTLAGLKKLVQLIAHEKRTLLLAVVAILINSTLNLLGPFIIGHTIDQYVQHKNFAGVIHNAIILLCMFLVALFTSYKQTTLMGGVGQRMLFTLRNSIFNKLQQLPVDFFNKNKAGDLISRVNNDTDKLNQFFSQSLMQFIGSIATMVGAGVFLLLINIELGAAALSPAVVILLLTLLLSPWIKRKKCAQPKKRRRHEQRDTGEPE